LVEIKELGPSAAMSYFKKCFDHTHDKAPRIKTYLKKGLVETNPSNIRKHPYLTSAKAVSVVP
jgi:hypothetical protein